MVRLLGVFVVLLGLTGTAPALEKVVLQLKWRHQFQFAGYYAAISQGYYRDAGLDVTLREAEPNEDPLENVLDGKAQYGVGTSNVMVARAEGKPVVVLAVIYQHSPFVLLVSESSNAKDLHDLAERPIMMEPDAAELIAYFQNEGIDPKKLHVIAHSFDVRDLISGKAAAMSAYSTDEPYHMKHMGAEYLVFTPRAGGIDFYGDNLYTTDAEIKAHPERAKAFLEASLKGWRYALQHREEMVDLILKNYNRGKTREQLEFEAEETVRLVHPELIEVGYINPGRWQSIAQTYETLGMIPKDFSLDGFIYERNPHLDLRWLYWLVAALALAAIVALGWTALTWRWNQRLRREAEARRKAEEIARAESAMKSRFVAVLAHEVRAPLAGIISSLYLHRNSPSDAEREETLDIAESSSQNLLHLIDQMLDHAKLDAGRVELEHLPVAVRPFVKELAALFKALAGDKGLAIREEIAAGVPETITTDPTRLRQILSNLLSNAVKFTTAGSVTFFVSAEKDQQAGKWRMIFSVRDTGPGLTKEQISRLFEPYAQADASIRRQYGGTGLGLLISSQLASLLDGKITVESEVGKGAEFTLTILAD